MPATTKGAWRLQEVRDATLSGEWVRYITCTDPGTLWAWGRSNCGRLGDNTSIHRSSPVQIPGTNWFNISGGSRHNIALKYDNSLWSWGYNFTGQLGQNDQIQRSSPVQIPGTSWIDINGSGFDFSQAIKSDGTLWVWGCNGHGQLGAGNIIPRSSPVQIPGTQWCKVASGCIHSLGLKTDGTLWAWGCNNNGTLGDNSIINRSSPVQIPGNSWSNISSNGAGLHSAAQKTDGTLWTWGAGTSGRLGDDSILPKSSPIQIPGTSWSLSKNSLSSNYSFVRKTDGTLWAWGAGTSGNLGDNQAAVNRSSPIQIPGTNWTDVSSFESNVRLALKSDGTLWSWGNGVNGNIGDGTGIPRSSPVQVPGIKWSQINAAMETSYARKSND